MVLGNRCNTCLFLSLKLSAQMRISGKNSLAVAARNQLQT
jgi:hypothetical protein